MHCWTPESFWLLKISCVSRQLILRCSLCWDERREPDEQTEVTLLLTARQLINYMTHSYLTFYNHISRTTANTIRISLVPVPTWSLVTCEHKTQSSSWAAGTDSFGAHILTKTDDKTKTHRTTEDNQDYLISHQDSWFMPNAVQTSEPVRVTTQWWTQFHTVRRDGTRLHRNPAQAEGT